MRMAEKLARGFESISPSAKSLLMMKAVAGLPYAREAADRLDPAALEAVMARRGDKAYMTRCAHFERRYREVEELALGSGFSLFLELASGFSFRCLDWSARLALRCWDTDLGGVIEDKRILAESLHSAELARGLLDLRELNALDAEAFGAIALEIEAAVGGASLCVVTEGLLVYLDEEEKRSLCRNVREALVRSNGAWVTGDVYLRRAGVSPVPQDERTRRFRELHGLDEKMFASFAQAEAFFSSCGLAVQARSHGASDYRATWRLVPA